MVERRTCNFCGTAIEPGTGKMYIKKDGTVYNYCTNKCKKNSINLKRVPRRTRWTKRYAELKESTQKREKKGVVDEQSEDEGRPLKKKKLKKKVPKKEEVKEAPPEEEPDEPVEEETGSEVEEIEGE